MYQKDTGFIFLVDRGSPPGCLWSPFGGVPFGGVPFGGVPFGGVPFGGVPFGEHLSNSGGALCLYSGP